MHYAVSVVYHRTFKSIIKKGLSHADVTTLSYSPLFCICVNKHDFNASLQWSI
jgi:hypothetical protein